MASDLSVVPIDESPWERVRRLSLELSDALTACEGDWMIVASGQRAESRGVMSAVPYFVIRRDVFWKRLSHTVRRSEAVTSPLFKAPAVFQ